MDWKEFFKPTKRKLLLFLIFVSSGLCLHFLSSEGAPQPSRIIYLILTFLSLPVGVLRIFLGVRLPTLVGDIVITTVYSYLASCLSCHVGSKIGKDRAKFLKTMKILGLLVGILPFVVTNRPGLFQEKSSIEVRTLLFFHPYIKLLTGAGLDVAILYVILLPFLYTLGGGLLGKTVLKVRDLMRGDK